MPLMDKHNFSFNGEIEDIEILIFKILFYFMPETEKEIVIGENVAAITRKFELKFHENLKRESREREIGESSRK